MKKIIKTSVGLFVLSMMILSCKKNDPITELGSTNGEFASTLRVTYNNTRPAIGDTLIVTASTWQRDDKFQKVEMYETVVESFGINMVLKNGSSVLTRTADESTLMLVDSIVKKNVVLSVQASQMDSFWVTNTNNYVIAKAYPVQQKAGKYANDATMINNLSNAEFDVLKGLLSYTIGRNDYLALFPGAPATHFTTGGTYVLSAAGMQNLRANLDRATLISDIQTMKKVGNYSLTIDVSAITPTNTTTAATRTFDITL